MAKTLGQMLKDAMERRGISGVELAERIKRSPSFVSELINDEKKVPPPPATLAAIERELGITQLVMLSAWGYAVKPSGQAESPEPGREAVFDVVDRMDEEERHALADAGEIFLRIRKSQSVVAHEPERVPALA